MKRVVALDVGEKRIGVAVSDPLGLTAQGVCTIDAVGWGPDRKKVAELMREYDTDRLVVGLPLSLSGATGPQAEKVKAFAEQLLQDGWQVRYMDERLTTSAASRALVEGGVKGDKRKGVIDKLAAVWILQGFLDAGGWKEDKKRVAPVYHNSNGGRHMDNRDMEKDNIVELVDDEGRETKFEHVMTVEHEGECYILLAPAEPMEDLSDDEVMILHIAEDENGAEVYETVEDEKLLEAVFNDYLAIVEEDDAGE